MVPIAVKRSTPIAHPHLVLNSWTILLQIPNNALNDSAVHIPRCLVGYADVAGAAWLNALQKRRCDRFA